MAQVFRKNTPKDGTKNNNLYDTEKIENHHYKELQEKDNIVFFSIQDNMQNNAQNNMEIEDEIIEKYKLVEERETTV